MKIWFPSLRNIIPEVMTALLMASEVEHLGLYLTCSLFLVNAVLLRFIWNSSILIHGFGHVLLTAILDKKLSFFKISNILENRNLFNTLRSLIPFSPIFIPFINSGFYPWVAAGNTTTWTIRIKALSGILFNIIALGIVPLFLSKSLDFILKEYGNTGVFISQFLIKTFVGANLLTVFSSLSDIVAFVKGSADYFNCGNFGFLGRRNPNDGQELLPQRVVEMFHKMGRETEIRGEQAGGGLVIAQNKNNQAVFIGKKIVNKKRDNLTKSLEAAFANVRRQAVLAGAKALEPVAIGIWHYRYATSSPPSALETHWHEWIPATQAAVWRIENGKWLRERKNVNHRITHNGDFDAWTIFNKPIENTKLGLWLERVLHTPNSTIGDSAKIAGMMDLLITQGMWYNSVRLAYQLEVAESIKEAFEGQEPSKDAPNTAPSKQDISDWAEIFEKVFQKHTEVMLFLNARSDLATFKEDLSIFEEDVLQEINKNILIDQWTQNKRTAFVKMTLDAFLHNDLYRATKIFMSRAHGSFGLVTVSTLQEESLVLSSQGQPISVGFNLLEEYMVYASEPAAVDAILSGSTESHRLDLNQKTGEIALVGANNITVYSMIEGRELLRSELKKRWTPMQGNPYIQPSKADTKDPVESDIKDISPVFQEIEAAWKNPSSFNRQSAEYLTSLLIEKANHFEAKRKRMSEAGLTGESEQLQTVDLLIIGIESSLWLGERFAQDLKTIFPLLNVKTLSSNQTLKKLHDFKSFHLGKYSLVLAISQSGQTFPTLHSTHGFEELRRKGCIGELFIMTGELSSLMGSAIGQPYYKGAAFKRRIFINGSGRRTAEPSTVAVAAAQQTLTELLFRIAKQMRQAFLNSNPFGMTLTEESLFILETIKSDFLTKSVVSITGTSVSGVVIKSPENEKLISKGQKWALNVTETPFAWGVHALYILITVGWVIPFGYTIPLIQTIFRLIVFVAGLPNNLFLLVLIAPFVTLADIAIYIFGPWLWTFGLRYFQGRQLLARTGKRSLIIGDVTWVHQLLKSYVSKLFSLSYGISSLEVYGANPQDHMLHNFGHRVVRGTLVFLGVPDGRRSRMQKNDESAVIMTGQQANGVRNIGVGPEIVVLGHNPEIEQKGFNSAITLWSHTDSVFEEKRSTVDDKAVIEELRESRFSSFERLLAGYVLFWALAKKVASFPFLKYQYWKSQSRTRIATTASPVSSVNLDLPEDEKESSTSIKTEKYAKPKY
ncbi:hypothetical protein [Nostoc sp.]|uniref:hypothetical protein n=1 Tax=Nostoc sp. TaxID=1180 RepID=UPI002FF2E143